MYSHPTDVVLRVIIHIYFDMNTTTATQETMQEAFVNKSSGARFCQESTYLIFYTH